ncbi:MAG: hypothetical protein JJE49_00970 [Peptostreptococcaceae bacterium]|nr:hypothetical protein [Peptostreptococcaceae bacterium]
MENGIKGGNYIYYILSVNPGSTSTKVALYEDEKLQKPLEILLKYPYIFMMP